MSNPQQQVYNGQRRSFQIIFNQAQDRPSRKTAPGSNLNVLYARTRNAQGGTVQTIGAFSNNDTHSVLPGTGPTGPEPRVIKPALKMNRSSPLPPPAPTVHTTTPPQATLELPPPARVTPLAYRDGLTKAAWLDAAADPYLGGTLDGQNRMLTALTTAAPFIIDRYQTTNIANHYTLSSAAVCHLAEVLSEQCVELRSRLVSRLTVEAAQEVQLSIDRYSWNYDHTRVIASDPHQPFDPLRMCDAVRDRANSNDHNVFALKIESEDGDITLAQFMNRGKTAEERSTRLARYMDVVFSLLAGQRFHDAPGFSLQLLAKTAVDIYDAKDNQIEIDQACRIARSKMQRAVNERRKSAGLLDHV